MAQIPRMSAKPTGAAQSSEKTQSSNFLRSTIEHDLARHADRQRLWQGYPGVAEGSAAHADVARVRTRFPPEPNGYLHIGHAKSIWLNYGLARDFCGAFHLRFDDTNPEKEEQEYVDSIVDTVAWLGARWQAIDDERAAKEDADHLYFASDYFERLYQFAEYLITLGYAYVDSQSAEAIRASRGTLTEPGRESPHRQRSVADNLALFRAMRDGAFDDGAHVLRARIDMAAANINLRDPVLYRIRKASHHRTGDDWRIYPLYDYTHCISDALENITHSICTLEFEDHRPLYDWVLERIVPVLRPTQFDAALAHLLVLQQAADDTARAFVLHCQQHAGKLGHSAPETALAAQLAALARPEDLDRHALATIFATLLADPAYFAPLLTHALEGWRANPFGLPHQHEFARLNLTYVITSKRRLRQLVTEQHVTGWDDPRMPTLVGLRRRGYTAPALQLFCERVGAARADSWIDYSILEAALRDEQDERADRVTAVLDPLPLIIDNLDTQHLEWCEAPRHPHDAARGLRRFPFTRTLAIERDDFLEQPTKGYFRLFPGNRVRLRHAYVVECTGCDKDLDGRITAVHAHVLPDTRSGTAGADLIKVKGNIHWVSQAHAFCAEVRLFDRLFLTAHPDAGGSDFLAALNPASKRVIQALLEPGAAALEAGARVQFERHGYFFADPKDSTSGAPVFNRITTLKDSWAQKNP